MANESDGSEEQAPYDSRVMEIIDDAQPRLGGATANILREIALDAASENELTQRTIQNVSASILSALNRKDSGDENKAD